MGSISGYNLSIADNGVRATRNVMSNLSWFRGTPYYWAETSLPFAYALACVEVVSRSSEKARILYNLLEAKIYYH
jgi:hypothetical protein